MRVARLIPSAAVLGTTALVGLAAAGCASNQSTASAAPGVTPAATTSVTAAATGFAAKLLTAKDLPAGWSMDVTATNPVMATTCPLLNSSLWNGLLPQRAEADMNAGMTGPDLVEQIAAGDAAQVDRAWQGLVAALPKCSTFTHAGSSGGSTFTITKLSSFPNFGDSSYAFKLQIVITGGVTATGNIVATRKGDAIAVVYLIGVAGVTPAMAQDIVSRAVGKL